MEVVQWLLLLLFFCEASNCGCGNLNRDLDHPNSPTTCEKVSESQTNEINSNDLSLTNSNLISNSHFLPPSRSNILLEILLPQLKEKIIDHRVITIAGGSFFMGTNKPLILEDREGPEREVTVKSFAIDAYEVSVGQFAKFVESQNFITEAEIFNWSFVLNKMLTTELASNPRGWANGVPWWLGIENATWFSPESGNSSVLTPYPTFSELRRTTSGEVQEIEVVEKIDHENPIDTILNNRLNHPVVHVSYNDAIAFCKWRGMRLPTEEEWEYAARGGKQRRLFTWGNLLLPGGKHMANIWQGTFPTLNTADDGWVATSPINAYEPNAYGLYNMAGNVWEWTDTWFDANPGDKVKKGGSYMCHESYCYRYRVASRSGNTPDSSAANLGFRCAKSLEA